MAPGALSAKLACVGCSARPRRNPTTRAVMAPEVQPGSAAQGMRGAVIRFKDKEEFGMDKAAFVVGGTPAADVYVAGGNVGAEHALLEMKEGRVYCTALIGEPGNRDANTYTWIDGVEIRSGVPYLVAPGARLAFGTESSTFQMDFEESGGVTWMLESVIMAWAEKCSPESRAEIEKMFSKN